MALTENEINEMRARVRAERRAGRPEIAAFIQAAMDRDEYYDDPEEEAVKVPDRPPISGAGSGKQTWIDYALAISDIDEEVLEALTREDILAMLQANGLVPFDEEPVEYEEDE